MNPPSTTSLGLRAQPKPKPLAPSARVEPGPISWVPRPRGRDLSGPELEAFVGELADRPELWIHLVKHDSSQRVYEELLSDDHVTAWLICWMDDHDTGFHDHDVSAGAVAVVSGAVCEQRLRIDGPPRDRRFATGDTFHFSPADIHRVRHGGGDPAVTLHVYSPPLDRMGAYLIGADGVLARQSVSSTEELRPIEPTPRVAASCPA
jgi:predicted metal-dependent enzyme (double-stranded beta helix superfamily)